MVKEIDPLWENYYQNRHPQTRDQLLLKYLPIVKYVAGRMLISLPSCVEYDDLVSAGIMGLIRALDRFNPWQGVKFETYVLPRIKGAILDELRTMDWAPRSLRSKARVVEKAAVHLEKELGRSVSDQEVATHLQMDLEDYNTLLKDINSTSVLSLDGFSSEEATHLGTRYEVVEDRLADNPLNTLEKEEMKRVLIDVIDHLPEQEKLVIALYYYEELTLREIGLVMNITESRVSQIHTKAITTLKDKLANELL